MKKGLAIALFGIVIALVLSTNAFALIRCTKTCPTLYKAYLIGGSCTCIKTGSLYEEVQDQVSNETKYPTAVEVWADPLPICWDSYKLIDGTLGLYYDDNSDDIDLGLNPPTTARKCGDNEEVEYDWLIGCGTPGNGLLAPGQNKLPYLGPFTGIQYVSKQIIDKNGMARLVVYLDLPQEIVDWIIGKKICPNPNWDIEGLPYRIKSITTDIVASSPKPEDAKCYERSVAVDYFELRNPEKILWDRSEKIWVECVEGTIDNCTATVPAAYEGLGLEFYDWSRELSKHPYDNDPDSPAGTCPGEIFY